jgi:hypothetical protein
MDEVFDPFDLLDADVDDLECASETSISYTTETMTEPIDPVFRFVSKSYCEDVVSNFRQQRLEGQFLDVTLKVGCLILYFVLSVLYLS